MHALKGIGTTGAAMAVLASAPGQAVETSHTVKASLCPLFNEVHATCRTTHRKCNAIDCGSLTFDCRLEQDGRTLASEARVFAELQSDGRFRSHLNARLAQGASVWYCGINASRYRNWLGSTLIGQSTGQDCVNWNAGGGGPQN